MEESEQRENIVAECGLPEVFDKICILSGFFLNSFSIIVSMLFPEESNIVVFIIAAVTGITLVAIGFSLSKWSRSKRRQLVYLVLLILLVAFVDASFSLAILIKKFDESPTADKALVRNPIKTALQDKPLKGILKRKASNSPQREFSKSVSFA